MADGFESRAGGRMARWPIAALRIYAGVFFLMHGWGKLSRGSFADPMAGFLASKAEESYAFYRGFIETVVLPNKGVFAFFVTWGEVALGVALILGLATRYAAFAGAFLVANFWFAKGIGFFAGQNHDSLWMMVLLALALLPAGQVLGLDRTLSERFAFLR